MAVAGIALAMGAGAANAALLSPGDRAAYRAAFAAAAKGDWRAARRHAARTTNPLPGKVLVWRAMTSRDSPYAFEQIVRFIKANPGWPRQWSLQRSAEQAIDTATPPAAVIAFFSDRSPRTAAGMTALGEALLATGRPAEGRAWLYRAWTDGWFSRRDQRSFLRRHGRLLSRDLHWKRLDGLLWNGRLNEADRMLRLVPADRRALAIARMRLRRMQGGVDAAIARLPQAQRDDPGLIYERLRWRRRRGRDSEALELVEAVPGALGRPGLWARERMILARRLLAEGRVADAHRAIKDHGVPATDRSNFAESEWLSGWIALRWLNDPAEAEKRFARVFDAVRYPVSRSRAAYWAGRAADAQRRDTAARQWFLRAAQHGVTYHGQLAALNLPANIRPLPPKKPAPPTSADLAAFNALELVQIVRVLDELGRDRLLRPFFRQLGRNAPTALHKRLVARLAHAIGRPDLAVWVSREAHQEGVALPVLGYPLAPLPEGRPERALLLALARQESNFDRMAVSRTGARGMMQLMPATARSVARAIRVRYSRARLTADADYNVRLGRAYLSQMLDKFGNSYLLSIAAYNAGPNAVKRWIRQFGDPRDARVDPIDWIELIPFEETRTYVQRVLGNLQVYRGRLRPGQVAANLETDLRR